MTKRDLALIAATRTALADGSARVQRESAGIRQREFAAALGMAQSTVSQWESGKRVPAAGNALAYARALAALTRKAA